VPGLRRPDPPRCCADLQRLTRRCSRSAGFAAPPAPFHLAVWTLVSSSDGTPGRLPSRSCHHSWPCTHPRGPRSPSWTSSRTQLQRPDSPARPTFPGVDRPYDAPSKQNPLPDDHRCQPRPAIGLSPRRGLPHPLRSAFAVSHDLDGLRLCSPCDLFQPLTPLGLGSRLPAPCPSTLATWTSPSGRRG
jgi:hypothetical protein